MKKMFFLLVLAILTFAVSSSAWAELGEATGMFSTSTVDLGTHLIALPVDLVRMVGSALWVVGEVIVFPFRLIF